MTVRILVGDAVAQLRTLPDGVAQCCVTSPPYWGLRDYGVAGQLGLEKTPDEYVAGMVAVFAEVRRVLKKDGTLWLNIGDSYAGGGGFAPNAPSNVRRREMGDHQDGSFGFRVSGQDRQPSGKPKGRTTPGLKSKDLVGIPWMLAFALRADGWYLRSDVIWAKPNPMPESVTDRPTKAHEYVFLLAKSDRYYYDAEAIAEESAPSSVRRSGIVRSPSEKQRALIASGTWGEGAGEGEYGTGRNKRSVWTIATQPFPGSHFATMPPGLAETCIKAGSAKGDTVLDPFGGAGTTGLVADRLGRNTILIELNPKYADIAEKRLNGDAGFFADVEVA